MYRLITTLFIFTLAFTYSADLRANDDIFSYDMQEINTQLSPLTTLENLHSEFPDKTMDQLVLEYGLDNHSFSKASMMQTGLYDPMPVLPAFWWGCFLGWVGILIVYLVTEDRDQTRSALWGCIVNGLFGCVIYAFAILIYGAAWGSWIWFL